MLTETYFISLILKRIHLYLFYFSKWFVQITLTFWVSKAIDWLLKYIFISHKNHIFLTFILQCKLFLELNWALVKSKYTFGYPIPYNLHNRGTHTNKWKRQGTHISKATKKTNVQRSHAAICTTQLELQWFYLSSNQSFNDIFDLDNLVILDECWIYLCQHGHTDNFFLAFIHVLRLT